MEGNGGRQGKGGEGKGREGNGDKGRGKKGGEGRGRKGGRGRKRGKGTERRGDEGWGNKGMMGGEWQLNAVQITQAKVEQSRTKLKGKEENGRKLSKERKVRCMFINT